MSPDRTVPRDRVGDVVRRIDRTSDEKLIEVVAAIDAMADRGEADAIIAPFRPRLARLRPVRPMTLQRLLYAPLDPVIVDSGRWAAGRPEVPRPALQVFTHLMRRGLGAAQFEEMQALVLASGQSPGGAQALGRRLWPAAGRLLLAAPCPREWAATGLAAEAFEEIRTASGQLLVQAVTLAGLVAECGPGLSPTREHIRVVLDELAYGGAAGFRLAVVVLLRLRPQQQDLAGLALSAGRHSDAVESAAMTGAMHALESAVSRQLAEAGLQAQFEVRDVAPASPRELRAEVEDAAALLRGVEAMSTLRPRSRMQREVAGRRPVLQAACLERFRFCVEQALLRPLAERLAAGRPGLGPLLEVAAELGALGDALGLLGDRYGPEGVLHEAAGQVRTLLEAQAAGQTGDPPGWPRLGLFPGRGE